MGNYKFRLSDMMPNAWFYKLRDMNKARNQNPPFHPTKKKLLSPTQNPRKSFHYTPESIRVDNLYNLQKNSKSYHDTDHFHRIDDSPRKSSKRRTKRKTIYKPSPKKIIPSVSVDCDSPETVEIQGYFHSPVNLHASPEKNFLESPSSEFKCFDSFDSQYESLNEGIDSCSSCCSCKLSSTATDIIIDMDETFRNVEKVNEFNMISKPELSPIVTKPATRKIIAPVESPNFNCISSPNFHTEISIQPKKNARVTTNPTTRKSVPRSRGVKIRSNLPRTKNRKTETCARKSMKDDKKGCFYSESFAMVKASFDPEKDFRDSMMEMIVENNLRASKELEELLACYLSLNPNQYHDLIIKAFEQIWFNLCPNPICS